MTQDFLSNSGWLDVVDQLGGAHGLDKTARATKAFVRARDVKSAPDLLRLCFAYGPGGMSLRSIAGWAEATGLAQMSDVAVMERLQKCEPWLSTILVSMLDGPPALPDTGRLIRIADGSSVTQAGAKKRGAIGLWRLHAMFDLGAERFSDMELTDQHGGERLDRAAVIEGEIRLGDRAYLQPDRMADVLEKGADIVVRAPWKNARWQDTHGERLDLIALLRAAKDDVLDIPIQIGLQKKPSIEGLRLIAIRKSPEKAEAAREKAKKAARGRHTSREETLVAAEWVLLVTSLDAKAYDADAIGALYRLRWRIEIAFKRLKSVIGYRSPRAKDPKLAKVFLLTNLIFALLSDNAHRKMRDSFP